MTEEIEPLEPVGFSQAIDNAKGDSPWDTESIAGWNTPAYWTAYYRAWRALADPDDRYAGVDREISVSVLVYMLTAAGELPRSTPQTLLDAGCGVALTPYLPRFCRW